MSNLINRIKEKKSISNNFNVDDSQNKHISNETLVREEVYTAPDQEDVLIIDEEELENMITSAFSLPKDWRTVGGISRDTGLPMEIVQNFIEEHEYLFEISPFPIGGKTLYSLKSNR